MEYLGKVERKEERCVEVECEKSKLDAYQPGCCRGEGCGEECWREGEKSSHVSEETKVSKVYLSSEVDEAQLNI